jgi:hypothetical protein
MTPEESLRALAADDAAAQVPPHVDAAVMAAWDAGNRERRRRERGLLNRRAALAWAIAGAVAVIVVAIAAVVGSRAGDDESRRAGRDIVPGESAVPLLPDIVPETVAPSRGPERPAPPGRTARRSIAAPPVDLAYVLVPDAGVGAPPLTMMRIRMPRSTFARLGVPIANPDGDGMVDVEVLVGEDGVARSIRRAAAVGWVDANR